MWNFFTYLLCFIIGVPSFISLLIFFERINDSYQERKEREVELQYHITNGNTITLEIEPDEKSRFEDFINKHGIKNCNVKVSATLKEDENEESD